ncbi:MAG: NfeD family protein [Acidobacteriota bacterium]
MPDGFLAVVGFLSLGYLLFVVELIVPGGILGILGVLSVIYGCYTAFDMGVGWGAGSIVASALFFVLSVRVVLRSKAGRAMMLNDPAEAREWKSSDQSLENLLGAEGVATTPLRPAGVAEFDGRRVDVVSDSEFLETGTRLRVTEVEGRRVEVESIASPEPAVSSDSADPADVAEPAAP